MSQSQREAEVEEFRLRIVKLCVLRQSIGAVTLWAFIWGTVFLLVRATQSISPEVMLWGLVGVPVAVALATRFAIRHLPDRTSIRALLDLRGQCGGLLMAGAERDIGSWIETVPEIPLPKINWNYRKPLSIFAISIVYTFLVFLLPIDRAILAGDATLDVGRETERLDNQVRILKEEKVLDAERAETIKKKLEQLRAESAGNEPAKSFEALDHLKDTLKQAAGKAAESSARNVDRLDKIETAAEALRNLTKDSDQTNTTALMAELAAMAEKAASESEKFKDAMSEELKEALSKGKFSPEQLAKLASASEATKDSTRKMAEKLYNGKLIDKDQLKACKGEGKGDPKDLAEYLKKKGGKCTLGDALDALAALGEGDKEGSNRAITLAEGAGKGGVSEGPGAAAIQFGDRSSENGTKFKPEVLPPGKIAALKESQLAGVSGTSPERNPKSEGSSTGALNGATTGGGSANTMQILPQHKASVERYFDRGKK